MELPSVRTDNYRGTGEPGYDCSPILALFPDMPRLMVIKMMTDELRWGIENYHKLPYRFTDPDEAVKDWVLRTKNTPRHSVV